MRWSDGESFRVRGLCIGSTPGGSCPARGRLAKILKWISRLMSICSFKLLRKQGSTSEGVEDFEELLLGLFVHILR